MAGSFDFISLTPGSVNKFGISIDIDLEQCMSDIYSSMFRIWKQWREDHDKEYTDVDAISQCMLQMMMLKLRTLEQMIQGVSIKPGKIDGIRILDTSSMSAIIREMYELAFIYHTIFVVPDTEEERIILINIWKIRGLNNRVNLPSPQSYEKNIEDDKQGIMEYRKIIFDILGSIKSTSAARKKIMQAANKDKPNLNGFKYIKNDDGVILGFEPVPFSDVNALFPNRQYEALYPFLSANSHPSFLGVLQFGQMYNANQDKETASLFAQTACICAAKMTKDVCNVITGGTEIKMGMSANESEAINMFGDI